MSSAHIVHIVYMNFLTSTLSTMPNYFLFISAYVLLYYILYISAYISVYIDLDLLSAIFSMKFVRDIYIDVTVY